MIIEPPRARRRWPLVLASIVAGLVVVAALGLWWFDQSLDRVPVQGLAQNGVSDTDESDEADASADPAGLDRSTHVLVIGSDDRSVLTPEQRQELSTGDARGERTEVLMLLRLDPDTERIDALRFPRDLLVERCDGSEGRINAAYAIGERDFSDGPSCVVDTLARLTSIPIHHVVKIDFRGFVDLVDAVGGVEVYLDEPIADRRAGIDLPAGCVDLDGADALGFVRVRQIDNDFERIGRQQQLLAAVLDQVATPSTLGDPRRVATLIRTAQQSLQLDEGLSVGRLRTLGREVAGLESGDLVSRTVSGTPYRTNGTEFLETEVDYAETLFAAFRRGELPSTPKEPGATTSRQADDEPKESRRQAAGKPDPAPAGDTDAEIGEDVEDAHRDGAPSDDAAADDAAVPDC